MHKTLGLGWESFRKGSLYLNGWVGADRRQHLGLKEIHTTAPVGNRELFLKWLRKNVLLVLHPACL